MKHVTRLGRRFLLLAIFCLVSFTAFAAPVLKLATLQQGGTIPKQDFIPCRLNWAVANPDDKPATVTLQLEPDGDQGQAVFSTEVTVQPHSQLQGSSPVVLDAAERYFVTLIQNGFRLKRDDIVFRNDAKKNNTLSIAMCQDSDESYSVSELTKLKNLCQLPSFITFSNLNAPTHWSALFNYQLIIIASRQMDQYTPSQLLAIRDYVLRGGHLLLATPEASFGCRGTLLDELLPWEPVATTVNETLDSLYTSYGLPVPPPQAQRDSQTGELLPKPSQPFLETVLRPDSLVLNRQDGKPAYVMRRFGIGTVQALAFNPFAFKSYSTQLVESIWNPVLSHTNFLLAGNAPDLTRKSEAILQQLQGFSIPGVSLIVELFFLYILGSILILWYFFRKRREASGWWCVCLYGVLVTCLILWKAGNLSSSQTVFSQTTLSTAVWQGIPAARQAATALLSKEDCNPRLFAESSRVFLRPQPITSQHSNALATSVLRLTNSLHGTTSTQMTLQQQRPRDFLFQQTTDCYGLPTEELPVLKFQASGQFFLHPWTLPAKLPTERALLCLPSAIHDLKLSGRTVSGGASQTDIESDTVFLAVRDYILSLRLQTPCLAILSTNRQAPKDAIRTELPEGTSMKFLNYQIHFVPVRLDVPDHLSAIPEDFVNWTLPNNSVLRKCLEHGEWTEIGAIGTLGTMSLTMQFRVLPELCQRCPDQIKLVFRPLDPSGFYNFQLCLEDQNGRQLEATTAKDGEYTFDLRRNPSFFSLPGCYFTVAIQASNDHLSNQQRSNIWKPNVIQASVAFN